MRTEGEIQQELEAVIKIYGEKHHGAIKPNVDDAFFESMFKTLYSHGFGDGKRQALKWVLGEPDDL